jgi:hypothetical protein
MVQEGEAQSNRKVDITPYQALLQDLAVVIENTSFTALFSEQDFINSLA